MSKIKIKIDKVNDRQMLMQILDMDERFRNTEGSAELIYCTSNGFKIMSSHSPFIPAGIRGSEVFLRGKNKYRDNYLVLFEREHPDTWIEEFKRAIEDWAENWPGWGEDEEDSKKAEANTIIIET